MENHGRRNHGRRNHSRPMSSEAASQYFKHSSAKRTNTDAILATALKKQYPALHLSIVLARTVNIFAYASSGLATFTEIEDDTGEGGVPASLRHKSFLAPAKRDGGSGAVLRIPKFSKFLYMYKDDKFIVYLVTAQDGTYDIVDTYYILSPDEAKTDALIQAAGFLGQRAARRDLGV